MPVYTVLEKITTATSVIKGLKKYLAPSQEVELGNVVYTGDDLVGVYEEHLAAMEDVRTKYAAWRDAVGHEKTLRRRVDTITGYLRRHVRAAFGAQGCRAFGWPEPKKPGPKTLAGKLAGVEKRRKK